MIEKPLKNSRIRLKKVATRGDEVAILFFSLIFLIFLIFSFFRLFAIGKFFDDFIFLFLFGWSKYLVYLALFIIILPTCFNYYFRFKFSFILAIILSSIAISWLVANIILITNNSNDIWLKKSYSFNNLTNYFQDWWKSTVINNYHGFFAKPLSFTSWTSFDSFFPSFASGGIIANALITVFNYGTFVTNWILNLILLFISLSWLFFAKPWLPFFFITVWFKPFHNSAGNNKKVKPIGKKSLKNKNLLDMEELNKKLKNLNLPIIEEEMPEKENSSESLNKEKNKEIIIKDVIQESGELTPFGSQNKKSQTEEISKNDSETTS